MAKNQNEKLSADVEAVIEEAEKLTGFKSEKTVPAQSSPEDTEIVEQDGEKVEGDNEDETDVPKKSFDARLKSVAAKLKDNRKNVIIGLAVVGAAAIAVAKFAAKTVVEEVVESTSEETENTPDVETTHDNDA